MSSILTARINEEKRLFSAAFINDMEYLKEFGKEAETYLKNGRVIALPTETVYGLGVRWDDPEAYESLCRVKGRNPEKPIAVMTGRNYPFEDHFVIDEKIKRVMDVFLPGPLTLLVRVKETVPYQAHLGTGVAGLRIPDKKELLEFLEELPFPLQVTSANLSGQKSLSKCEEVVEVFEDSEEVAAIVCGTCESDIPTSVVDFTGEEPKMIRRGEIGLDAILKVYRGGDRK